MTLSPLDEDPMQNIYKFRRPLSAMSIALSFALLQSTAHAQDWSEVEVATHEGDQDPNQSHQTVGLGTSYTPAYEGADKYRVTPLPAIDLKYGRFFANLRNGIGVDLVETKEITVGASLAIVPGYRKQDAPSGIGALSTGAGGRVFVSLKEAGIITTLSVTKDVAGGTKGALADASVSYPIPITPRLILIPSIAATWADAKFNNGYFGVDAQQSEASGLSEFRPGGGMKDASTLLNAHYRLTEHVNLDASLGATTLLGNDKDSPIVYHRNARPIGFVSVSYKFGSH